MHHVSKLNQGIRKEALRLRPDRRAPYRVRVGADIGTVNSGQVKLDMA